MPRLPHLDDVTGVFAGIVHGFGHRTRNTLAQLDVYRGLPLATLFPAPPEVPSVERRARWSRGGVRSEDVHFASFHEPLEPAFRRRYLARDRETRTASARWIRPPGSEDRPRLLYLHGYMQPETPVEEWVLVAGLARRLRVEVLQLQPPYHGRRKPRRSRFDGEFFWTADLVRSFEALRQSMIDARSALAWMRARDERPVGVAGLSLGGALALGLTCLDEGLGFSMPVIAHMDVAALVEDAPVLGRMRRELRGFGWHGDELRAFLDDIGWNELGPKLPPPRIHLFAASEDRFFRPERVTELWQRWGRPPIRWYPCSHMGFMLHLPAAIACMRSFVDQQADAFRPSAPWDEGIDPTARAE